MREGKYFRIPDGPADLTRLWLEGSPLAAADRPAWMAAEDVCGYRSLGWATWPSPVERDLPRYLGELDELRARGVVADPVPGRSSDYQFYLRAPTGPWNNNAVFAIGLYFGDTPVAVAEPPEIPNPVFSAQQVTDMPAAFVADPFLIKVHGLWHMFFEAMNSRTGNSVIGLAVSLDLITWSYQQIVLAEPFHLSYPHVFEWQGHHYLIPESHQAGAVRLYRADRFPTQWSFVGTLLEGPYLANATPFRHHGQWWLFVDASPAMDNSTLRLYAADKLLGPWREHPRGPVVVENPCMARPAGRVVNYNHRLYRFAQACLPCYGTEVRAFEIAELTPAKYHEIEIIEGRLPCPSGSGWNACGMHHIDAHELVEGWWVACVDGWTSETVLQHRAKQAAQRPA
jgi:hypothetical protein